MKKLLFLTFLAVLLCWTGLSWAHFQLLLPSDDIVTMEESRKISLDLIFTHPMEGGPAMEMVKPDEFGVFVNGKKENLISKLKKREVPLFVSWHPEHRKHKEKATAWQVSYQLKRPGNYQFYVVPKPYFEPAEETFILQITKVVVNAFGMEEGWDEPIGLKAEIVPLTRPYGLWEGNTFRGLVLINGKPASDLEVEVEYYNKEGIQVPNDTLITQVVKTDSNGIFSYTIPWSGWWAFAALGDGGMKKYQGKEYPIELDAVIWVYAYPLPK